MTIKGLRIHTKCDQDPNIRVLQVVLAVLTIPPPRRPSTPLRPGAWPSLPGNSAVKYALKEDRLGAGWARA